MPRDLSPELVRLRLLRLAQAYVPMTEDEARRLLEPPPVAVLFADGVASRLAELRALLELTASLQGARRSAVDDRALSDLPLFETTPPAGTR